MFENFKFKRWKKNNLLNNYPWYFGKIHLMTFEIEIIKKYHKQEIDDLKLRICMLEDEIKEHSHISPRDILGLSDIKMGKIPSRKDEK